MSNDVRIKIKIDADTRELSQIQSEVKKLGGSFNDTDNYANVFLKRLSTFGHAFGVFQVVNKSLVVVVRTGVEFIFFF